MSVAIPEELWKEQICALHFRAGSSTIYSGIMTDENLLPCDGCGQPASPEHIRKRLARLEWTTRYRPVHIGTLLLGGIAPASDSEFVYSPGGEFTGEAGRILAAAAVARDGRSMEAVLGEFQRGGFLLAYLLECPLEASVNDPATVQGLLRGRLPAVLSRIRRSLKPKRIIPISSVMEPLVLDLAPAGCPIVLDGTKPFDLDVPHDEPSDGYLRKATGA